MSTNKGMWMMLVILAVVMEGVALFYQYVLGDAPCVVCIHVRLWVGVMLLVGLVGLLGSESKVFQVPAWLVMIGAAGGFAERAWHTFAVEKGWIFSTCGFDLGLPEWFAIDRWVPWVFEPTGSCGYTPDMVFGFTMADVLIGVAVLTVLFCIVGFLRTIFRRRTDYFH
jgi:disulfide bond formation protein DsbB